MFNTCRFSNILACMVSRLRFFALPEALGVDGTVADPSQIFVARCAAVPRNGAVTVELRVEKEKLWFQAGAPGARGSSTMRF